MNQALFSYIAASPTAFQAVDHTAKLLELEGYRPLRETEEWTLEPGGRYYVTRNGSSLIAFRLSSAVRKPCREAKAHCRSSSRGAEM